LSSDTWLATGHLAADPYIIGQRHLLRLYQLIDFVSPRRQLLKRYHHDIQSTPLRYDATALEPHISAKILGFHHGKHHRAYVTNFNNLTQNTRLGVQSLESIIRETTKDASKAAIFNNAAQS
jgi:hypothetical protein